MSEAYDSLPMSEFLMVEVLMYFYDVPMSPVFLSMANKIIVERFKRIMLIHEEVLELREDEFRQLFEQSES